VDTTAILTALIEEKEELEIGIRAAVNKRSDLNASIKTQREELAKIDRLLKAAAGRAPRSSTDSGAEPS